MKVGDFAKDGNTMKADEIPAGRTLTLTISGFDTQTFKNEDGSEDEKCVILFDEDVKDIATGVLNLREIERTYGDDMDTWVGRKLQVSTALKSNDKLGFVLRGIYEEPVSTASDAPSDPFGDISS